MRRIILSILILAASAHIQDPTAQMMTGVVVESVREGSPADLCGMEEGDILLSWETTVVPPSWKGPKSGPLFSHLDIWLVETGVNPAGRTKILGKRNGRPVTFEIAAVDEWNLLTRPGMGPKDTSTIDHARHSAETGDMSASVEELTEFARRCELSERNVTAIWIYEKIAALFEQDNSPDPALEHLKRALAVAERMKGAAARVYMNHVLAKHFDDRGQNEPALDFFLKALEEESKADGGTLIAAYLMSQAGKMCYKKGDYESAQYYFSRALKIRKDLAPGSLAFALNLDHLGTMAYRRGDVLSAEEYYERSHDLIRGLAPGSIYEAASLNNLGMISDEKGEPERSAEYYELALGILREKSPGSRSVGLILNNLGISAYVRGRLSLAADYYRQALEIFQRMESGASDSAMAMNNLGLVAFKRGDLVSAQEYYARSLSIVEKFAPESLEVAVRLNNLGMVAQARGDLERADEHFTRSLEIKKKRVPGSLSEAATLNNLGLVAEARGDLDLARDYFEKSHLIKLKIAPGNADIADSLTNLGVISRKKGDLEGSERYFKESLSLAGDISPNGLGVASNLYNLGINAALKNDHGEAESLQLRSLEILKTLAPGSTQEAEAYHELGSIYRKTGETEKALLCFQNALGSLELQKGRLGAGRDTKERFAATFSDFYRDLVEIQVLSRDEEAAIETLERFRAKSLLEMLAERDLDFEKDAPAELLGKQKALISGYLAVEKEMTGLDLEKDAEKIDSARKRLAEIRKDQEELIEQIRKTSPLFASLQYGRPIKASEIQGLTGKGTLLLQFCVGKTSTTLLTVYDGDIKAWTIQAGSRKLYSELVAFRMLLSDPGSDSKKLSETSLRLYDLLLRPAQSLIKRAELLLICPDGPLYYMPFGALKTSRRKFIVDDLPISTVLSATVLRELKKLDRSSDNNLAAFGNPVYQRGSGARGGSKLDLLYPGRKLTPIPSTELEVDSIASIFHGKTKLFKKEQATEENARQYCDDASMIHFACHGILDERFPLDSGLVLTIPDNPGENNEDGIIQAWEIFEKIRIRADLVTLSACETGLGKEMGGEGLIGLTRAFQYAGAKTVLSSLWSVSDESTAVLMTSFYTRLKEGKDKAEALRLAQSEMIRSKKYSHPFYWAGFVLSGDGM